MLWLWSGLALVAVSFALVLFLWRPLRRWGGEVQAERARELFLLQRERLELKFHITAAGSGKPRGLHWKESSFDSGVEFARDRRSRQLIALVPVTIRFEAIEGSDMEGLPAVGNLRNASAVFFFQAGHWMTTGKAVFNMNPDEALRHFHNQYEPLQLTSPQTNAR
jgi:hypothetical protein